MRVIVSRAGLYWAGSLAAGPEEGVRGGAFGVVALVGDIEAGFVKPGSIVVGGGVAPPHRGCAAQPVGFAAGPSGLTGGEEQPAAGPQPAGDPEEQPGLL